MAQPDHSEGKAEAAARAGAQDKALTLLARREHSRYQLRIKLAHAGYADTDIEAALDQLAAAGYQSDRRFAQMLVHGRIEQGYGPLRVRAELRSNGVADATGDAAMAEDETDWPACAQAALQRHFGSDRRSGLAERARRMRFLLRRGFPAGMARAAVDAAAGPG